MLQKKRGERHANQTYSAAQVTAFKALFPGDGDAEITEAGSVGDAEITLATSEGSDEVTLATEEAQVADTLAGEETSAQESLDSAIAGFNATDAETTANDEAATTSDEGTDENSAQQQLSAEEVTTATGIAGAQADYAISIAQIASAAASAIAQASPNDGAAQFNDQYAQGYVTWLTALKPTFVTNATAVAQAAGQDEIDTLAADVTLADEQASENADFVTTETPQSDQESATLEQEGDTYSTREQRCQEPFSKRFLTPLFLPACAGRR